MAKKWITIKVTADTYGLAFNIRERMNMQLNSDMNWKERESLSLDKVLYCALRAFTQDSLEELEQEAE